MPAIEYAKKVLRVEADAILGVIPLVDENFVKAVSWILECKGRVIVSGMGKSGLIGEKLSATMASTGTPSLSLHPAEAIHGDLGRVLQEDIVIAISNGGETAEILRLLPLLKKIGAKVIAITGKPHSTLANCSDLTLSIGKISEACPLGLAPTASTTAMLALGDALAMCVSRERKFTREEYALYHPGGSLGRRLMTVAEVMRTGKYNPVIGPKCSVMDAITTITTARAGAVTVVDEEQHVLGFFTDGDLRRHLKENINLEEITMAEVMTKNPFTIKSTLLVEEACHLLKEKKIDEIPVIDDEHRCIGMLDVQDLLEIV
ncbi:KpsF/GutQ family sugar-phosphate isomerase [Candidatus Uabimicrobium amorphum]|uniref:Arabinose-5-phosphate isomerase n=1 Tax=Uabimicrobium amorphum TaxID=2596890 RepID=A0A5S9INR2_UABAM|nr:KpsF/GutQ family sugar-phosphate isomerase [Candidatus Uabimicrobium amorphum]BBM85288.1 arabinose-5-phosphate isomerase [Candidatus Uabimicrobium amorphum]